jgi:hypothetical protein
MTIVFYVSGHGFGHAVRQIAILNALVQLRPDVQLIVRTSVVRWLFQRSLRRTIAVQDAVVDVGAVQRTSVDLDVPETVRQALLFHRGLDGRADEEARLLESIGARLVVSDIPALPFVAAARAGVRAIGISNFTWDWIYEDYAEVAPDALELAECVRACYAHAAEGWRLPMTGGFESFPMVRDLPLVARIGRLGAAETRDRLGLPGETPLVLVSFGGFRSVHLDVAAAAVSLQGIAEIVVTSYDPFPPADGVHWIDEAKMYGGGVRYEDLLGSVDIVASKPGYGIISDCSANQTRLLYTSRGRFREYHVLVAEMPRYLRCEYIDQADLMAGRWREPVERLLSQPSLPSSPPANGSTLAASWLSALLSES